jgi:predicted membrane-bound spermidine synthase
MINKKLNLDSFRFGFVVFVCGSVLMALEIAGGRLLTPLYGSSVFVWGAIIGIFLIGLSAGYFVGGKVVDKKPFGFVLGLFIILAAVFTFFIPLSYLAVVDFFSFLPRSFSPLASAMCLFLLPSIFLGSVSPFAIRLSAKSVSDLGSVSGNLYALATLGSVIGTFLATFVLVIFLPITLVFFWLGVVLFLVSFILVKRKYFFNANTDFRTVRPFFIFLVLLSVVLGGLFLFSHFNKPVESGVVVLDNNLKSKAELNLSLESAYGQVRVVDSSKTRSLILGNSVMPAHGTGVMGEMDLNDSIKIVHGWEFNLCFENPLAVNSKLTNILSIGLGPGTFSKRVLADYNYVFVDAVDINPVVIDVAKKYFSVTPSDRLNLIEDDGRMYLQNTNKVYDLIVMDAYSFKDSYKIPFHLVTQEFFELAKKHLSQNGVFTAQYVLRKDQIEKNSFFKSEYKTLKSVFKYVYVFDCLEQVVFASDTPIDFSKVDPNLLEGVQYTINMNTTDSPLLTHDFAPISPFDEVTN